MKPAPRTWQIIVTLVVAAGLLGFFFLRLRAGHELSRQGEPVAAEIQQRESAHRQADPPVPRYRQVTPIPTGLAKPRAVALGPGDRLYVAGDREVRAIGAGGGVEARLALAAEPRCLVVSATGEVYVGLRDRVQIWPATALAGETTQPRAQWVIPSRRALLTSLTLGPRHVWVGDAGSRVVWQYDRAGNLVRALGKADPDRGQPGMSIPGPHLDVVAGAEETVWVAHPGRRQVEQYNAAGELLGRFGKSAQTIEGFCGCCNPVDLALLPDGRVVTAEKGLPRVKAYRPDGTLDRVVALPEDLSPAATALDLAVESSGRILVLDPPARLVRVFAEE